MNSCWACSLGNMTAISLSWIKKATAPSTQPVHRLINYKMTTPVLNIIDPSVGACSTKGELEVCLKELTSIEQTKEVDEEIERIQKRMQCR